MISFKVKKEREKKVYLHLKVRNFPISRRLLFYNDDKKAIKSWTRPTAAVRILAEGLGLKKRREWSESLGDLTSDHRYINWTPGGHEELVGSRSGETATARMNKVRPGSPRNHE